MPNSKRSSRFTDFIPKEGSDSVPSFSVGKMLMLDFLKSLVNINVVKSFHILSVETLITNKKHYKLTTLHLLHVINCIYYLLQIISNMRNLIIRHFSHVTKAVFSKILI